MPDEVLVGPASSQWHDRLTDEEILGPVPPLATFSEDISEVRERTRVAVGKITVTRALDRCHRSVARLLRDDERRREKQRTSPFPSSWDSPRYDSPLDRRRLRILNALLVALEPFGCTPLAGEREGREVVLSVGQGRIAVTIDRVGRSHATPGSSKPESPNDELRLEMKSWVAGKVDSVVWQDEADNMLEGRLSEIALELLVCGEIQYRESVRLAYEWRLERRADLEEKARRLREEGERRVLEHRLALQKARVDRLLGEATALHQANAIRAYVAEVRAETLRAAIPGSSTQVDAWASWALSQADSIDPIRTRAFLRSASSDAEAISPLG